MRDRDASFVSPVERERERYILREPRGGFSRRRQWPRCMRSFRPTSGRTCIGLSRLTESGRTHMCIPRSQRERQTVVMPRRAKRSMLRPRYQKLRNSTIFYLFFVISPFGILYYCIFLSNPQKYVTSKGQ